MASSRSAHTDEITATSGCVHTHGSKTLMVKTNQRRHSPKRYLELVLYSSR